MSRWCMCEKRSRKTRYGCKSTFHHFYNAYIRLWVFGFYAIFFSYSLRFLFVLLFTCFKCLSFYRGGYFFLFVALSSVSKMLSSQRCLSHLTRLKLYFCGTNLTMRRLLFSFICLSQILTYDLFMIPFTRGKCSGKNCVRRRWKY